MDSARTSPCQPLGKIKKCHIILVTLGKWKIIRWKSLPPPPPRVPLLVIGKERKTSLSWKGGMWGGLWGGEGGWSWPDSSGPHPPLPLNLFPSPHQLPQPTRFRLSLLHRARTVSLWIVILAESLGIASQVLESSRWSGLLLSLLTHPPRAGGHEVERPSDKESVLTLVIFYSRHYIKHPWTEKAPCTSLPPPSKIWWELLRMTPHESGMSKN